MSSPMAESSSTPQPGLAQPRLAQPRLARAPLPLPIELGICLPLGALANLFDPQPDAATSCIDRGRHELAIAAAKLGNGFDQAKGTGQLAIAFGIPLLRRRIDAKIAESKTGASKTGASKNGASKNAGTPQAQQSEGWRNPPATVSAADQPVTPDATMRSLRPASALSSEPTPLSALPIPGYDTLSASQVVECLGGLSAAERDRVRDYEIAHRSRRTILGKIDQLQSAS